jgi:nucleotide sugar dehydrogenase
VVVGTEDERAQAVMRELYRPLSLNETPIVFTGRRTSELIKYAANAFLAMKITFINEMADLCEKVGADVQQVAKGIGLDKRIGGKFLNAGPGYGGSCFPKDTIALVQDRPGLRRPGQADRDHGRGQRRPQEGHGRQGGQGHRRATWPARPSACWA